MPGVAIVFPIMIGESSKRERLNWQSAFKTIENCSARRRGLREDLQVAKRKMGQNVDRVLWARRKCLFVPCGACSGKMSRVVSRTERAVATKPDLWANNGRSCVQRWLYFLVSVVGQRRGDAFEGVSEAYKLERLLKGEIESSAVVLILKRAVAV